MIQMKGQEAVNQAYYVMNNKDLFRDGSFFTIERETLKEPVTPERALADLKSGTLRIDELTCEILSVWDVLLLAEKDGRLAIHPAQNVVLIFNHVHGNEVKKGIRAFVTPISAFEAAVSWAMQCPVIEQDHDFDKFILNLRPGMVLRKEAWKEKGELLRYSFEIANELMRIFELDSPAIWENLIKRDASLCAEDEPPIHGGILLDEVLEKIRCSHPCSPPILPLENGLSTSEKSA